MKKIAILGCTGSIGTQTLDVVRRHRGEFEVVALTAYQNEEKLAAQCREFSPKYSALAKNSGADCQLEGVRQGIDLAVVASSGLSALNAVIYCVENNIDVAIATKEIIVAAGRIINDKLKTSKSRFLPVDSEHSAVWQCLRGEQKSEVSQLILTASGGAFREKPLEELQKVTYAEALRHPTWNMGSKITVDSATMFNKALEVLEAEQLFGVDVSKIKIAVHPQSIIHALVEFCDGQSKAILSAPDMRVPIEYALFDGQRQNAVKHNPDCPSLLQIIENCGEKGLKLELLTPDFSRFPCGALCYSPLARLPLMPAVMLAANDACVAAFTQNKLSFTRFANTIEMAMKHFAPCADKTEYTVENISRISCAAGDFTQKLLEKK